MGGTARAAIILTASLAMLLAALIVKDRLILLPDAPPADRISFDTDRALDRLARILGDQRAHPVDSDANDAVRGRLFAEMRSVGLEPRIADSFACNENRRAPTVSCARVRNLVATIGPGDGRHLLLSAHYDSTFAGPGAADAGIGVATLLETALALQGRPLSRPVTFLFNEGEEMGLIGARAFLEHDPIAPRVGALLNFEARGVEGPAVMFETSRPNAPPIARFARASERPFASSLATDLYRLIPNSTDVAVFESLDWTILNFGVIGNETLYHSAGDVLAALDRRSLAHMGAQSVALALDFATMPAPEAEGERLYVDLGGRQLVTLPLVPGLILLASLFLLFLLLARRRRALRGPLAAAALAILIAPAIAAAAQLAIGTWREGDWWRGHPWGVELGVHASAVAACVLALLIAAPTADRRRLRAGWWLAFTAVGALVVAVAPGGAVYFLLPPLAAAAGMLLSRRWPASEQIGSAVAILLLALTLAPALALFEELRSNGPHWMLAPIGVLLAMPVLVELKPLMDRIPRLFLFAGVGDLLLVGWAAAALLPPYAPDRRQHFTVEYVWDADARRGAIAVNNDGRTVPFEAPWRRVELPHTPRPRWAIAAPPGPVPAPRVERVASRPIAGGRLLTIRLVANDSPGIALVAPPGTALRAAGIPGRLRPIISGSSESRPTIRCTGRACDGAMLQLALAGTAPVEWLVTGTRPGLPVVARPVAEARAALARPQYQPDSTIAFSRVRF